MSQFRSSQYRSSQSRMINNREFPLLMAHEAQKLNTASNYMYAAKEVAAMGVKHEVKGAELMLSHLNYAAEALAGMADRFANHYTDGMWAWEAPERWKEKKAEQAEKDAAAKRTAAVTGWRLWMGRPKTARMTTGRGIGQGKKRKKSKKRRTKRR